MASTVSRYVIDGDVERVVSTIRSSSDTSLDSALSSRVADIINELRQSGDAALVSLTAKFDSPEIKRAGDLKVSTEEIERAYSKVSAANIRALRSASKQISFLAREQMKRFRAKSFATPLGFRVRESYVPFRRIGGYVPGALASYPSTVLMICDTARQAGVTEIILATPPRKDGTVDESVLVAADICGVGEIIKAGGAQAIAALAFGTETIKKVDLIAGPGNQYVAEAKRQVAATRQVMIESVAGPTELLIIADSSANPTLVAEDLISQAEHGNKTLCGVVSDSQSLIQSVTGLLEDVSERPRLEQILQCTLFTVRVKDRKMMLEFAQAFAPEHLEVMTKDSGRLSQAITNSGLVLLGDFTPCSSTDYIAGSNHILPTGGTARVASGLAVENFLKRVTTVTGSHDSLNRSSRLISTLATMENFPNHANAALARFRK